MLQEALDLLACPRCAGRLGADLRCSSCAAEYGAPGGIPDLRLPADERTETVREFYAQAPFPGYPARDSYGWLRARAGRSELARLLDQAISGDARIVEVGCGTGQMSLFLATADRLVIGADLTRASLELAEDARRRLRRRLLQRSTASHSGSPRLLRRGGPPSPAGRNGSDRPLQRLRAPAAPLAARHGPPDRLPLDPLGPGAARAERGAGPPRGVAARPISARRGAPPHAGRSAGLVPRERSRVPARVPGHAARGGTAD